MKLKLLILVLGLQSAWLLGTVFVQERALRQGTVVLLETQPVDPRDLLRGDYIVLNYPISRVPEELFSPRLISFTDGQEVWVALAPRGAFHEAARASAERFTPGAGEVLLRGRLNLNRGNRGRVDYGLERYYVREGTGNPEGRLTVQAVVPQSGRARIKQVFVDGKPYAEAMKGKRP